MSASRGWSVSRRNRRGRGSPRNQLSQKSFSCSFVAFRPPLCRELLLWKICPGKKLEFVLKPDLRSVRMKKSLKKFARVFFVSEMD
ncbi:hypothetical protein MPTK2_1g17860 [Marchantia polymorpha subsp. ruderalis]